MPLQKTPLHGRHVAMGAKMVLFNVNYFGVSRCLISKCYPPCLMKIAPVTFSLRLRQTAVMESFFSTVKSELADRFDTYGDAKMELFEYIEVFDNQRRRHSTLGQISPAAFERRANEEGAEPVENRQGRGFPQAPHPLSFSMRKEQTTKNDQLNEIVH